jgi:hypothetical protein
MYVIWFFFSFMLVEILNYSFVSSYVCIFFPTSNHTHTYLRLFVNNCCFNVKISVKFVVFILHSLWIFISLSVAFIISSYRMIGKGVRTLIINFRVFCHLILKSGVHARRSKKKKKENGDTSYPSCVDSYWFSWGIHTACFRWGRGVGGG